MGQFRGSRGRDLARQFYHSGMSPFRMSGTRGSWHFARRHLQYEAFLSTSLPFRALPGRRISRRGLGQVLACDPRQVVELVQLRRTGPRICSSRKTGTRTEVLEKRIKDTKSPRPRKSTPKTGRAPRAKTASKKSPTGEEKPKKEKAKPAELSAEKLREKLWKTKERLQAASGTPGPTLEVADSEEDLGETGASTSDDSDSVEHEMLRRGRFGDDDSGLAPAAPLKKAKKAQRRGAPRGHKRRYYEELEWTTGTTGPSSHSTSPEREEEQRGEERVQDREASQDLGPTSGREGRLERRPRGRQEEKEEERRQEEEEEAERWSDSFLREQFSRLFREGRDRGSFFGDGYGNPPTPEVEGAPWLGAGDADNPHQGPDGSVSSDRNRIEQGPSYDRYQSDELFQSISTFSSSPHIPATTGNSGRCTTRAAALDLLRQGEVAKVGDTLAARFIALHQSMLDASWNTARHLELFPMEDASAAGPAAILATRKHAREVSKAQGILPLGGWGVSSGKGRGGKGRNDWSSFEPNPDKGKDKGKAKKGKGKWNQGSSSQWEKGQRDWEKTQDKGGEKP